MGIVYFLLTKFADMFFGNQPESDYEMMGVMEDVYDYEDYDYGNDYDNDYNYDVSDDRWFYGYLV